MKFTIESDDGTSVSREIDTDLFYCLAKTCTSLAAFIALLVKDFEVKYPSVRHKFIKIGNDMWVLDQKVLSDVEKSSTGWGPIEDVEPVKEEYKGPDTPTTWGN